MIKDESEGAARGSAQAFTLIELLVVIAVIIILAGLVLSISRYAMDKGARSRAETEIAAMSAALESYKADNGIYPRDTPGNGFTDALNAQMDTSPAPSPSKYTNASFYLYSQLSGLNASQQPVVNLKSYFTFKPQMLGHPSGSTITVTYIRDPWGSSYGYSTANQNDSTKGYNPTFDLWSTAGPTPTPAPSPLQVRWLKNW